MRRGVLIGIGLLLVGGGAFAAAPWTGPGGGDSRAGVADANLTAPLLLDWRFITKDATWTASSPAATDSAVVFAVGKKLYCLDTATGNKRWEFKTTGVINSNPTIDNELVFVGDHVGMLYVVNIDTGRQFFNYRAYEDGETPTPIQSGFAVIDNIVYFGDDRGMVHRVRARADYPTEPGRSIGKLNLGEAIIAAPTYSNGSLYFSTITGVVALQDLSGAMSQRWSVTLARGGGYVLGSPVVAGDRLLVPVGNSLVAINADTGRIVWNADGRGSVVGGPAVKGDSVVFTDMSGVINCVSLSSGQELWHEPLTEGVRTGPEYEFDRQPIQTSPIIAGDLAFVRTRKGTVVALNLSDGKIVWRYKTEDLKGTETTATAAGGAAGMPMMGSGGGMMGSGGGMMGRGGATGTASDTATTGGKGVTDYSAAQDLSSGLAAVGDRLFVLGGTGTLYALTTQGVCSSSPYVRKAEVFLPNDTGQLQQTGIPIPVYNSKGDPDRTVAATGMLYTDGKLPDDGPIVFQVKVGDLGIGLDPASIKVTLEGPLEIADPLYFESAETIQIYIPERNSRRALESGDYKLKIAAANFAGRVSTHEIRFTIDADLPSPTTQQGMGGPGMGPGGMGSMGSMGGMVPGMAGGH